MRFESRTWFLLSLLFFMGAVYFWLRGNEYEKQKRTHPPVPQQKQATNPPSPVGQVNRSSPFKLLSQFAAHQAPGAAAPVPPAKGPQLPTPPAHRLSNSARTLGQLTRVESAILMRNALIDTAVGTQLPIPDQLRAPADPGSYIVQARGPIDAGFRQRLRQAGAQVVSYIPNNAYLVTMPADAAQQLLIAPETQAVLPYEPYYKLDSQLLAAAVEQKPLSDGSWVQVTAFPGARDALANGLAQLGGEVVSEDRTPFGPRLLVKPAADSVAAIARLSAAQIIELYHPRALMNDLTRVQIGLTTNGVVGTSGNYLGLTGTNILINLADTGIDSTHPDLQGRIFVDSTNLLSDFDGHGTHVAGTIAGNGSQSATVSTPPFGSDTNANFRGMAPAAQLFVERYQFPEVNRSLNDTYLQETAARTNAVLSKRPNAPMVSNNSWGYVGAWEYDSSSASYDAAVRDALPDMTGAQPMLFVFAAGNSGNGTDQGDQGDANSIPSPANAKNVIAVGAIEHMRFITNSFLTTNDDGSLSTNTPFLGQTDSSDEVAAFSSRGNVGIGTEGDFGRFKPDVVAPGTFIVSTRSKQWQLSNDFDTNSPEYQILNELDLPLAPYYRYETGTSQAAPTVTGMLALMQEFFEQKLPASLRRTNSAALMKALLINGARSVGPQYDFQVQSGINYQGWGLVNITNTLPAMMLSQPQSRWPIRYFDQSPTNALATGQSKSWNVTLSTNSQDVPLHVTLVWTDPPGNPGAALKLVNDLDLVVSNADTGVIYYGNNIPAGSDYTQASATNDPPVSDVVNNVENVFIADPGATNFTVTVTARRVNVTATPDYNQATGQINDVVQDFALVISLEDTTITNGLTITPVASSLAAAPITPAVMTNGVPLLNQRAGANSSLFSTRNGITSQWDFFVFTNIFLTNSSAAMTNGTNVAFVTFLTPNVARPRVSSADIDLYVSKDPGLLNLDQAVLSGAFTSLTRSGTEAVVFTNAAIGDVFYIGVKSEDQQAGEFGLIGLSSDQPFDEDKNGSRILHGMPVPQVIPDGSPFNPGHATVIAIGVTPITIKRARVDLGITHEDVGDLSISLTHNQTSVILHNHTLNNFVNNVVNAHFLYDDSGFGATAPGTRHSDGPGSLNSFAGSQSSGVWILNAVDNALTHTGRVESLTIQLDPFQNQDLGAAGSAGISGTVAPNDAACFFVDVPVQATNLVIQLSQMDGPLDVLIEHGSMPTTNLFTKSVLITPPGGDVTLGANDLPFPLEAGRYFICLYNPGSTSVNFHIATFFQLGVGLDFQRELIDTNGIPLVDNGVVSSTLYMPADKTIADVQVKVRIDHPRSSDLVLHLISPQGKSILLAENRGGPDSRGYGTGTGTNITYTIFTEDTNLVENLAPIKFSLPPWTNLTTSTNPPVFADSFETDVPGTYLTNQSFTTWTVTQGQAIIQSPTNTLGVQAQDGTNFVQLDSSQGPATVVTTFSTVQGATYALNFYYQRNPLDTAGTNHLLQVYCGPVTNAPAPTGFVNVTDFGWESTNIIFTATDAITELQLTAYAAAGPLLDNFTVKEVIPPKDIFVLPEEPLSQLQGARAIGNWTLEVMDDRAGPPGGDTGTLIDWRLQLEYGNPGPPLIVLTNGMAYSGSLTNNQTNFFRIDVCDSAQTAFVTVAGMSNTVNLLVDRKGIPTGDVTDDFAPQPNVISGGGTNGLGFAAIILDTDPHQPAPLEPGKSLYLAVHNLDTTQTNAFTVQASFDPDTCSAGRPVIRLVDDVPYTNLVAPSSRLFDYYVFNVTPTAIKAQFEVQPENGDVGLIARYGLPLPALTNFDYQSDLPGLANELIVLTNTSKPVGLNPGDWYLAVYNNTTNPVAYNIRASEVLDTNFNLVRLTNTIPVDFTIGQGAALTNYFLFKVFQPHSGVQFDLTNLTGNADFLIGFNRLPSYTNNFSSNSASPAQPVSVQIHTNDTLPTIEGSWVLEVINKGTTNLTFTVLATLLDNTNTVPTTNRIFDPNITVSATNICFSWDTTPGLQYQLEGKKTVVDPSWAVLLGPFIATNSAVDYCLKLPTDYSFFRVVESGASTNPPPSTNGTPVVAELEFSTNSICLSWASFVGTNYTVKGMTTVTDVAWTTLTNITATLTNTSFCLEKPTPYQFFEVLLNGGSSTNPPPPPQTNGTPVTAELELNTNSVCLSWTSLVGTNYTVEAKRTIVDTNWTTLTNLIATTTNTTFCVKKPTPYQFFQVLLTGGGSSTNPPPQTNGAPVTAELELNTNSVCLSWTSLVGTNYTVEAKRTIVDTNWTTLTNLIATTTDTTFCLKKPTPYQFFQVLLTGGGSSSTNTPPPNTNGVPVSAALELSTNSVCLSWPSLVGTNYIVEGKRTVVDTNWTTLSNLVATAKTTSFCLPRPTPFQFFQVLSATNSTAKPPSSTNQLTLLTPVILPTGGLRLTWDAIVGAAYTLEVTTNLRPVIKWTIVTNVTATGSTVTVTDTNRVTNGTLRIYQVLKP